MASTVDELTVNYEENGVLVVKELDKAILSKGTWATILFRYQEMTRGTGEYGASSPDQARKIIEILQGWIGD